MIIHKSPYPDISVPEVTLPTFVFRPLLDDTVVAFSNQRRLDEPLVIPAPYHEEYNRKPQRSGKDTHGLSLRELKERAEGFALGLEQQEAWRSTGRVLSIVSENQVSSHTTRDSG